MTRRFVAVLSVVVVVGGVLAAGPAIAGPGAARLAARAGSPELSTASRLQDRREVAAGTRAYSVGFQDGRFYANG